MTSDFFRAPSHLTKNTSHSNLSSIQSQHSSQNPSYSVYEKALGKELLPSHNSNSSSEFSHKPQRKNTGNKYPSYNPNNVSGVGNFGVLLSNAQMKHDTPPSLVLEDTTDKQGGDRSFHGTNQRASESFYVSKSRESKSRSSITVNLSTNISHNGAVRPDNGINITSWLESCGSKSPFNSGNVGYNDESGSTKDNSMIENNLASNHMFLRNLENLTTILNEPQKQQGTIVQTKYRNVEDRSVGRKGVNNSMIQVETSGKNGSVSRMRDEGIYQSYNQINDSGSQNIKGRSASAMQTRREDVRVSHQQTTSRDRSFAAGNYGQEDEKVRCDGKNAKGPIQEKNEEVLRGLTRESSRGNLQLQMQAPSKNHLMQKMLKKNLDSRSLDQSKGSTKHSSLNMGYDAGTNKLNYGQIRLLGEPIEDTIETRSRGRDNNGSSKPYWQLKKTAAKLEASKKSLVSSLMKNSSYMNVGSYNIKGPYGIEGNSSNKQATTSSKGLHQHKKSSGNIEVATKGPVGYVREIQINSADGVTTRNLEKKGSNVRPGSAMGNVGNGARKEIKSMEMKRSMSGKLHGKIGEEHGKENNLYRNPRSENNNKQNNGKSTQSVHKFEANRNDISYSTIREKATPVKERTNCTIEESSQKGETVENQIFVPQLVRGRSMMKYKEYPDDDFSPVSFDLKNQAISKSFTSYTKPEPLRPLSETRSSSKDILTSLKDFSYGVVRSTKEFFQYKYSNQKPRTKCKCMGLMHSDNETCPKAQKWLFSKYKESELDYLKKTYEKIRDSPNIDPKCSKQIGLDIKRTYPECEFFASGTEGLLILERVLQCYAKYDPKIGYVQGMNFIAAAILYHAEEYIAFWILILIFEKSEMRDVYMHDLPGLAKHSQIIDFLIFNNLSEIYKDFCEHSITVDMFCTEWIFGLFGSVIPVEKMDCFLDGFVEEGWLFFYKFVLALLKSFEKELLEASDMSEILIIFKSGINKRERTAFNGTKERVDWERLVKYANLIQLDSSFIHKMLSVFDQETKRFLLNSK